MKTLTIGQAREEPDAVAPDGIPIHLVLCDFHTAGQEALLGPMRFLSLAEGRIPPGQWGVHAHGSLEQVSYVLEGEVVVQTRDTAGGHLHRVTLKPGQAIVTLPTQTLSFANPGPGVARVLFICAPPYPADDSDTLVLHRAWGSFPPARDASGEAGSPVPLPTASELGARHRALTPMEIEHAIAQHERMMEQMLRVFDDRIAALRLIACSKT